MKLKIMTFNVQHCLNFVERHIDFPLFSKTIAESGADIVGLNEVRGKGLHPLYEEQAQILAQGAGYKYHYFAKAIDFDGVNPYGNAVLSKYPIIKAETVPIPDPAVRAYDGYYETRCIAKLTVYADGPLTVLCAHFGLNRDEHENARDAVLRNVTEERCVLMGDFNVQPQSDILDPIRAKMKDTADGRGDMFSFPSDKPDRKIDYIFVSKDAEVVDAGIPALTVSDHRPHTAEIII
jgi:endonuclease/exonuclease/phosphatase family metal-dependent hydrolase